MKNWKKGLLLFLFFVSYLVYLYWRAFYTIPTQFGRVSLVAGIILLVAEIVGFFESSVFYYTLWDTRTDPVPDVSGMEYPHVDIFIATYNEPEELLFKTITGCKNMDYPDPDKVHIYVCDDGDRSYMKALCQSMEVNYIRRDDNLHAKAGNLNHALSITDSPFVVTFDADMIPMHDFLMSTIPYFMVEKKLGYIQVPQNFYNVDLFQYNLFTEEIMPNEQDLFSRSIQAGKGRHNAVIYAGSNTVLSRAALDEIGGLVTGTITEDFATGMKIQSKGYNTRYVNEVHASGLAPESLEDLYNQRIRWGRGVIQTFRAFNPLFMKGLSIKQKILYFSTFSYWYFGLWRLIFFLAPILFSVFGIIVLDTSAITMILIWLPMFLFTNITFRYFTKQVRSVSWSHIYDTILFPQILIGVLKESFGVKMKKFKVTPKENVTRDAYVSRFELVYPQMILAALSLIGIGRIGFLYFFGGFEAQYVINLFWLIYNVYVFAMAIFFAFERPKLRGSERIAAKVAVLVESGGKWNEGYSTDISEKGITMVSSSPLYFSGKKTHGLRIETGRYIAKGRVKVVRVDNYQGKYKYIFEICEMDEQNLKEYLMIIYDRIPVFPTRQKRQSMFSNITRNIRRRNKKLSPLNRKLPRVLIHKTIPIFNEDNVGKIFVEDFNYEYISTQERAPMDHFFILVNGSHRLYCSYDEILSNKVGRGRSFYGIENYEEEMGMIDFQ